MMNLTGWKTDPTTEALRNQINDYVSKFIKKDILHIPFRGYRKFIDSGSRKEFEKAYFNVRKQLVALGLYLQWKDPSKKEIEYFNELLWQVSNEFSWCLAAHLSYGENYFIGETEKNIDLFSAETAETLSELLILHKEIIDPFLQSHLRNRIKERVIEPFLSKQWGWETSLNNWCAVCSGSIGIVAMLLEPEKKRKLILDKVDIALEYYLQVVEEGFISKIKPVEVKEGLIEWKGCKGHLFLVFDPTILTYKIEERKISNHMNQLEKVYRLGLYLKNPFDNILIHLEFIF